MRNYTLLLKTQLYRTLIPHPRIQRQFDYLKEKLKCFRQTINKKTQFQWNCVLKQVI